MRYRSRRGITLINLLAAFTSLGLLAALALQQLPAAREAANASSCENNLKQLAMGSQFHHDQRGDCVPMGMFSGGVSWTALELPYLNESTVFRQLRADFPYDEAPNNGDLALKARHASMPLLICPSRRRAPQFTDGFPVSDYVVPSVGVVETLNNPTLDDTWMQCHSLDKNFGPFLLVHQHRPEKWKEGDSIRDAMRYRSKTSMASFVDGASMQIVFGEKAIHPETLGKTGKGGDFTAYAYVENDFNASGAARPGRGGISPGPGAHKDDVYRYWGSWHPDYCQFAMGDGSVRKLNVAMSDKLLASLCNRQDGAKMSLPDDHSTLLDNSALAAEDK